MDVDDGDPYLPMPPAPRSAQPPPRSTLSALPDPGGWLRLYRSPTAQAAYGLVICLLEGNVVVVAFSGSRFGARRCCTFSLQQLQLHHGAHVPPSEVNQRSVESVRALLLTLRNGSATASSLCHPTHCGEQALRGIQSWSLPTWQLSRLEPIPPRPGAPPSMSALASLPAPPPVLLGARAPRLPRLACLRILTHNVGGLSSLAKVTRLFQLWSAADVDVICLQETWVGRPQRDGTCHDAATVELWLRQAAEATNAGSCSAFWGSNTLHMDQNNGVAIIIRHNQDLGPDSVTAHSSHACGRLQSLRLRWGGHSLCIVNTYWPCTGHAARASFISDTLCPHLSQLPDIPRLLVGDFNYTPSPQLDRQPTCASTAAADTATHAAFSSAVPDLVDTYRAHHPHQRSFTFHRGQVQPQLARLDRILASPALAPSVIAVGVLHTPAGGEHNAVVATLLPTLPLQTRGPGRRAIPWSLPITCPDDMPGLVAFAQQSVAFGLSLPLPQLLAWWPTFLHSFASQGRAVFRRASRERARLKAELQAAIQAAHSADTALWEASGVQLQAALAASTLARSQLLATASASIPAAAARWGRWVRAAEQPAPLITALMRPATPTSSSSIPTIASLDGTLLTSNSAIANRLSEHYASISGPRHTDREAQATVLAAIAADVASGHCQSLPPDLAADAGNPIISEDEVRAAMATCPADSSPGPDGLPYSLWRIGGDCLAPLLAHMYTAVGTLQAMPPGFNAGTITPILKPGVPSVTAPAAYRPITLLNAAYRILGKVLAHRYGLAMAAAIGPEQAAFLPGRRIEDNINFEQLLPHAVAAGGDRVASVYLDIAKAFDTVDREFLFQAMAAMGATAGMLSWARILLTDTVASVHANGVESAALLWHSGVRQGCPLSPLLYLFVGQGLASWLRAQPELGVTIDGWRYVSSLYADDSKVITPSTDAAVTALTSALATFELASGQKINLPKCLAILIGLPPPDGAEAQAAIGGIPVGTHKTHLGVPTGNVPPPPAQPSARRQTRAAQRPQPYPATPLPPHHCSLWNSRIATADARLQSVTRLPLSAIGRGLATSTYALSTFLYHAEFSTPPPCLAEFRQRAARAVARGVAAPLLCGSPAKGGFGLLPLTHHTSARHAAIGGRLVHHLTQPPPASPPQWARLARFLLQRCCPDLHPAQALLACSFIRSPQDAACGFITTPGVRQQHCLPPGLLTRIATAFQALGPPLLPNSVVGPPALQILTSAVPAGAPASPLLVSLQWRQPQLPAAAAQHAPPPPPPVPVAGASVRALTRILAAPFARARQDSHTRFCRQALQAVPNANISAQVAQFQTALHRAWRLPCTNSMKEPLWRLAVDGIPGHHCNPWRCPCSLSTARLPAVNRSHSFWDCPVAATVRHQLASALPPGTNITRASVWLLGPPPAPNVHHGAWSVVCLAAIAAMEYGRALLWAHRHSPSWPDPGPDGLALLQLTPLPYHLTAAVILPAVRSERDMTVATVGRAAAARFWHLLQDFAHVNPAIAWDLPQAHPFLHSEDGALVVRVPV